MNVPFLLGSMVTPDRDRAKLYGIGLHFVNGVLFAWLYLWAFLLWNGATWWKGLIVGGVHGAFLLTVFVTLLPSIHPRMANEQQGPTVLKQIEPPGFMGLHYGLQTPLSIFLAHLVYGLILGLSLPHAE